MAEVIASIAKGADGQSHRLHGRRRRKRSDVARRIFPVRRDSKPSAHLAKPVGSTADKRGSSHAGILDWTRFRFLSLNCDPISWRWRLGIGVVIGAFDDPSDTNHPINRADLV